MDVAQPAPLSPGMDRNPSTTLESSVIPLSQEPVDEDTSRVIYATPRDSVEHSIHPSPEEDTAKSVVSVAIFLKNTNFITKIRAGLLETGDDNAINHDLNADTILPDRVYLKRWKVPDKADDRHIKVKEKLENVKCYSIEFSGKNCTDTADERCTAEKRNDPLGQEPTTDPMKSCLGVPAPSTQKPEAKGPTTRSKSHQAPTVLTESFWSPTSTLTRTSADVSRLAQWSRSA